MVNKFKLEDLMIDIETLGTKTDAAILSIAAVFFDPVTGETGATFHGKSKWFSLDSSGIDPEAVKWWLQQDKEAQNKLTDDKNGKHIKHLLEEFIEWVSKNSQITKIKPWGNGATFDIVILERNIDKFWLKAPWRFWNIRDVRTIVDLGSRIGIDHKEVEFEGVKHDALDDAKHQVKYVNQIIKKLLDK